MPAKEAATPRGPSHLAAAAHSRSSCHGGPLPQPAPPARKKRQIRLAHIHHRQLQPASSPRPKPEERKGNTHIAAPPPPPVDHHREDDRPQPTPHSARTHHVWIWQPAFTTPAVHHQGVARHAATTPVHHHQHRCDAARWSPTEAPPPGSGPSARAGHPARRDERGPVAAAGDRASPGPALWRRRGRRRRLAAAALPVRWRRCCGRPPRRPRERRGRG
ncbi:hypothetical protein ACQJBY_000577 [Aegilops geniculata]